VISQDDATIWLARFPALGDVQGNVALRAIYPNQTAVHDANVTADDDATVDDDAVAASTLPATYDIDVWATRSRNAGLGDAKTVVLQRRPVWKSTSASGAPDNSSLLKSFLGDDAAVLAPSSGEEPASPRHRAGVASMA